MANKPSTPVVLVIVALVATAGASGPGGAQANHKCDPVDPISDVGWSVVPSLETVGTADGAPFQAGAGGDWFIERTTTLLPFCNYYNEIGIYSMRCLTRWRRRSQKSASGSAAVPPRGAAGRSRPTPGHALRCNLRTPAGPDEIADAASLSRASL